MDDLAPADRETAGLLDATRHAWCAAIGAGDARAAAAAYAPDAWLLTPYAEPAHGTVEVEAFWRTGIEAGLTSLSVEVVGLWTRADVAFEVGRYRLRVVPEEGEPAIEDGSYLVVHQRQGQGGWLHLAEALEPGRPVPPLPRSCNASRRGFGHSSEEGRQT